jgi:hypothetical protein
MFKWLSVKKSEAIGTELAELVIEFAPNDPKLNESKRDSKSNYAKERMLKKIRQFKQEEDLNFYKIAKLLNTFKWALKDADYDQQIIDSFASWILINIREYKN